MRAQLAAGIGAKEKAAEMWIDPPPPQYDLGNAPLVQIWEAPPRAVDRICRTFNGPIKQGNATYYIACYMPDLQAIVIPNDMPRHLKAQMVRHEMGHYWGWRH